MFDNIPEELRSLRQWVIWRYETTPTGRQTKVPYSPATGHFASVTNPADWSDWFTANAALAQSGFSGLGFVLTDNDPYTFIDLDNTEGEPVSTALQQEVFARFGHSYSERSPSGKGLHIIVKGRAQTGKRRWNVELYSTERYMTMTGDMFTPGPILEQQSDIDWLWNELGGNQLTEINFIGTYEDKAPDRDILNMAANAQNGQKFMDLYDGKWQQYYGSQSEADYALIDMLAFYTTSVFQIVRLFRSSELGKRDKAQRDKYVLDMVRKSFDRHLPPVDLTTVRASVVERYEEARKNKATSREELNGILSVIENPYLQEVPGLVGQIAYYIYKISPRPVPEIALASAIALMSGICGRSYNVSNTGLNQYIMLLAGTGRGKESVHEGISRLMEHVSNSQAVNGGGVPAAKEFIGPGDIASGQALIKYMDTKSKSFVTVQGEIDNTLKQFTSKNANAAQLKLKQILLAAYSRSGNGSVLEPLIYSDKEKNTGAIKSPAITLLGEGTPERFFSLLDEALVADGLLPRFTVIYYEGERVARQERIDTTPPTHLVRSLAALCGQSLSLNQRDAVINVGFTPEAKLILDDFDRRIDGVINDAHNDVIEQIWNRAHLKALKLAAVIAVGCNYTQPVIDLSAAKYAIDVVSYDTFRLVARFQAGDIGDSESRQVNDLRRIIRRYLMGTPEDASKLGISREMHAKFVIPKRLLQQRTANMSSFKNARLGATIALNHTLLALTEAGIIAQVGPIQTAEFGAREAKLYFLLDRDWLTQNMEKDDSKV